MLTIADFRKADDLFPAIKEALDRANFHWALSKNGAPHRSGWAFLDQSDAVLARYIRRARNWNSNDTPAFLSPKAFSKLLGFLARYGGSDSEANKLKACFDAYRLVNTHRSAKRNPEFIISHAPSSASLDAYIQESEAFSDLTSGILGDDAAFNDFLDRRVRIHIYGDAPALAIKHAYSAAEVMHRSYQPITAVHGDDIFWRRLSYIARIGGWTAQQSGQWPWLSRFKKFVETAAASGNLDAIATESELLFHWQKRERDHIAGGALAARVLEAVDAMPHQHLWRNQRASVVENAVTEQLAAGKRLNAEFGQSGKSIRYHLDSIIDGPAKSAAEVNNRIFQHFALAKAATNERDLQLAGDSLAKAETLLSRSSVANNTYTRSLYRLAVGLLEKRSGSKDAGDHFQDALGLSLKMGAVHRARRAVDWAATRQ